LKSRGATTAAILATVVALTVVALRLEGRVWWCACGGWSPWAGNIWSEHASQHLFDPYSFTHVLHGFVFSGFLRWLFPKSSGEWRLLGAVVIEAIWEAAENSPAVIDRYRTTTMALGYEGDSILNSVGDVLACAVGVLLAQRWGVRISLIVFVLVEGLLLVWIRDNLTLNVLMLIAPIEAIKQWQGG